MSYSKDKLKEFALEYVNEIRKVFGRKPIKELKKGLMQEASCCVITKSIGFSNTYVTTGGDGEVAIPKMATSLRKEKYVKRSKNIIVDFGDAYSTSITIYPRKSPKSIEKFIEKFDAGFYPELIAEEV